MNGVIEARCLVAVFKSCVSMNEFELATFIKKSYLSAYDSRDAKLM